MVRHQEALIWPAPPARSFVGRVAPLALLQRSLDEALGGAPRAVLVEGDAGIGKSRLVAELLDRARRRGAVVLVGRCSEDLNVPYLALATALDPLGGGLDATPLLDPGGDPGPPTDPLVVIAQRTAAPLVGACRAAVTAARRRPIVLLLEDLHWADPHTAELLEQLVATSFHAGMLASTAILFVVTLRPGNGHVARTVERLQRESAVRSLRLVGMSELELNELITSIAPARPSRGLLSEVTEVTGGNPLLVRTMVARQLETGGLVVRDGELVSTVDELVPGGLDHELRRRLDDVGRPCRELLTKAAFLGDGALLSDLESIAPHDFDDLLTEAEHAGLLRDDGERYTFDHPLVRQLLYHEPGGRNRQRLHLSLADELEGRDGDDPRRAIEIADHLRRSGPQVDGPRLASACRKASEQAFAVAAWGSAARFLDVALDADPPADTRERARMALESGIGHFRDHDLRGAEARLLEAIDDAKAAGDLDTWGVAALLLTRARFTIGSGSVGSGVDTAMLAELLDTPGVDDRLTAQIVSTMAEVRFHAFDVEGGLTLLERARQLAENTGDDALATHVGLAAGLQHLGRIDLDAAAAAFHESARHARQLADPWQRVWGLGRLPIVEIARGELATAAEHAAEAAGLATATHDWAEHALASACTTQVATCRAEFANAEATGELALQMYRRSDYAFVPPLVYPALASVRAARGDVDGALAALDDWASVGGRGLAPYRLLVIAETFDRDELSAMRPFRPVGGRPVDFFTLPILCAQAEVASVIGDTALLQDAFDPLVAQHHAGVRWCVGWPLLLSRLIAAAARGLRRLEEAARWCERAAAEAASQGAAGDLARIDLERAAIAAALGDAETAHRLAAESALVFDRLGMLPLHQQALRQAGGRAREERVMRTVLFTDLVDSTATNVLRGDDAYVELLDEHNAILRRRLRQFDGVEMKHTGDGLSAWFTSPTSACECALAIRDDLADHNATRPEYPLHVRFGIASGAPIARERDLFGVSVSLAARLCAQAVGGQVLVSADVTAAIEGSRLSVRALDPVPLKGFPDRVAVFAVGVPGE